MFKSIRRLYFLKGLTNDGINFSPGITNWIQSFRRCSGLMGKKNEVEEVSDDLTFTAFIQQRREEARRSIIIMISNRAVWEELLQIFNDSAYVNKIFQYRVKNKPYALIEMTSKEKLHDFLKKTLNLKDDFDFKNSFLETKSIGLLQNLETKHIDFNWEVDSDGLDTNFFLKSDIGETIFKLYSNFSLNDLGIRLRFIMCSQIEALCAGFIPNPIAYPFGSSVTGFGASNCDLDISLVPSPMDNTYFFHKNLLDVHRTTIQEHITVISGLMKMFMVGCSELCLIRNARVPIVKYRNSFTDVECDLSLYNLHGVLMSQFLYTLSSIDKRVRPLVLGLKMWACNSGLVNKMPGRKLTNFALTLLTVFFLQHTHLLPSWDQFPQSDGLLVEDEGLKNLVTKYRKIAMEDSRSLGELYHSFFKFYTKVDFKKSGMCLRTGEFMKNNHRHPLFIENPLLLGTNVSGNVAFEEVQKMIANFNTMEMSTKKSELKFSSQQNQLVSNK